MTTVAIVLFVVFSLLLLVVLFFFFQLLMQSGRILLRLDALERDAPMTDKRIGVEPYIPTLQKGVPAPPISLPDLAGTTRHLSEWRGRRVLLVFFDPENLFSRRLLPSLVALTVEPVPGRPVPVLVSMGDRETNRQLIDEAGFTGTVLLQDEAEVAGAYKVDGTPMAYLVDADGTLASDIAVGIQAVLVLAGEIATITDRTETYRGGAPLAEPLDANARPRSGLAQGAQAPLFRLPRLDGSEVSLLDYRGRNVVIVFSDPDCGPCEELAPLLQAEHEAHPDLDIIMVSRGDVEATRAQTEEFGFTFPVVTQRHWEISREYGIFAVPVAFHVDEWGTIAADIAISPEGIVGLIRDVAGTVSTQ